MHTLDVVSVRLQGEAVAIGHAGQLPCELQMLSGAWDGREHPVIASTHTSQARGEASGAAPLVSLVGRRNDGSGLAYPPSGYKWLKASTQGEGSYVDAGIRACMATMSFA